MKSIVFTACLLGLLPLEGTFAAEPPSLSEAADESHGSSELLAGEEVPAALSSSNPARREPIWVTVPHAIEGNPERWTGFEASERSSLRSYRATAGGPVEAYEEREVGPVAGALPLSRCPVSFAPPENYPEPLPHRNLEQTAQSAHTIVTGKVVGSGQGFLAGVPGTLLKIEISEPILEGEAFRPRDGHTVFVYYPFASFQIGGEPYCTTSPLYPHRPRPGDRVLLLLLHPPLDPGGELFYPVPEGIFFRSAALGLIGSPSLVRNGDLSEIDDLQALVRRVRKLREIEAPETSLRPGPVR